VVTDFNSLPRPKPLVVLGGTFDPPHVGHLIIADDLYAWAEPSAVVFVPAAVPPHKIGERHAPPAARLEMAARAVAADPRFAVAALEIERGGVSYTIDTVRALRVRGFTDIRVAVGADNLPEVTAWREWEALVTECRLVVMTRPGYGDDAPAALAGKIEPLPVTPVPLSSSLVRARVAAGKPFRYLVPPAVYEYITTEGLYR
jgi:nicotinate-nucleotide adenylyltransferase